MQALVCENVGGLTGGIEFFFCAVAGGEVLLVGLDLASGSEGADQDFFGLGDLGLRRSFDRGSRTRAGRVAQLLSQY